jgi:hypothetical protein
VNVALAGGTVAEEGHRHRVLAEPLGSHGRADGMQRLGADRNRYRSAALLSEIQPAMPCSAPRRTDITGRDAAHEKDAQLAVLRKQPVGLAQAGRGSDLCRLLAAARRKQR